MSLVVVVVLALLLLSYSMPGSHTRRRLSAGDANETVGSTGSGSGIDVVVVVKTMRRSQ